MLTMANGPRQSSATPSRRDESGRARAETNWPAHIGCEPECECKLKLEIYYKFNSFEFLSSFEVRQRLGEFVKLRTWVCAQI